MIQLMKSINPKDGKIIQSYEALSESEVKRRIENAHKAQLEWKIKSFSERGKFLLTVKERLLQRKDELARLMALEMGKPLKEGVSEIEKCAWVCEYYAEKAEGFLSPLKIETDFSLSKVVYNPLGVVLAVMPWNFPFWQVFRFAAPGLMAGNVGVLKHASNVSGCALAIEELFSNEHQLFQTLLIPSQDVEKVITHPRIAAVTLTGSTKAGKSVARIAGEELKKCVLELGGSDPYLILEDADLKLAAELCTKSRLINGGQSCIAAKRFIIHSKVHDEFVSLMKSEMEKLKQGDPLESGIDLGPMARVDLRDDLHQQVEKSLMKGAECILGGKIPEGPGAFYPPTILTNVKPGMPAYEEEIFGPVASIIKVDSLKEAITIANTSSYGLGSGVFTRNAEEGERIATFELEAGSSFVNDFVKSDPRLPFGGIKESGFGRELSEFGIREFVNIKTVCVR